MSSWNESGEILKKFSAAENILRKHGFRFGEAEKKEDDDFTTVTEITSEDWEELGARSGTPPPFRDDMEPVNKYKEVVRSVRDANIPNRPHNFGGTIEVETSDDEYEAAVITNIVEDDDHFETAIDHFSPEEGWRTALGTSTDQKEHNVTALGTAGYPDDSDRLKEQEVQMIREDYTLVQVRYDLRDSDQQRLAILIDEPEAPFSEYAEHLTCDEEYLESEIGSRPGKEPSPETMGLNAMDAIFFHVDIGDAENYEEIEERIDSGLEKADNVLEYKLET